MALLGGSVRGSQIIATKRCLRDPFQSPDPPTRRQSSTASYGAPSATRRARSRRRPAEPTRATGGCSPAGARSAACRRSEPHRPRSRHSWPRRPTAVPARHGRPPRRGDRRRAPRAGPSEPVRLRRGPAGPLGNPPPARHRTRAPGGAARPRAARAGPRRARHVHPGRTARPGAATARVRRGAAPLGARRLGRRAPRVHDRPRAAGDDRLIQDRPRAGRSDGGGPVRARGKRSVRGPGSPGVARGRRNPPRPRVPADAPRRHHQRRAAHRPVGRADYQAPCESRGTRARAALRTFGSAPGM